MVTDISVRFSVSAEGSNHYRVCLSSPLQFRKTRGFRLHRLGRVAQNTAGRTNTPPRGTPASHSSRLTYARLPVHMTNATTCKKERRVDLAWQSLRAYLESALRLGRLVVLFHRVVAGGPVRIELTR